MPRESISRQTFVKGLAAGAVVAASLGTLRFAEYSTADKAKKHNFVPGTYSSSAQGMESDVKVTITVDEKSITDVQVDVSGETDGIGAAIGDEVKAQILDAQTPEIDGVAGASVSSQAVRDALVQAIEKAEAGEADPETEAVTESDVSAADANDTASTDEAASADSKDGASNADDAGSAEAAGGADSASAGSVGATGGYVPGTYSASAQGIESEVKVDITVDESAITDVAVDVSGETAGLGADIGDEVISQILAAQSADIDGVAGATVTSDAVRTAAAAALAQAGAGAEDATAAEAGAEDVTEAADDAGAEDVTEAADDAGAEDMDAEAVTENAADASEENAQAEDMTGAVETQELSDNTSALITADNLADYAAPQTQVVPRETEAADAGEAVAEADADDTTETQVLSNDTSALITADNLADYAAPQTQVVPREDETADAEDTTTEADTAGTTETQPLTADTPALITATNLADYAAPQTKVVPREIELDQGEASDETQEEALTEALSDDEALTEAESVDAEVSIVPEDDDNETADADTSAAAADTDTEDAAPTKGYTPGTYTGTAAGLESDVTVTITFSEDRIVSVGVNVSGETEGVGAAIGAEMAKAILASQSAEVDTVAGATITSNAVIAAAQDCLEQAK